MWTVPSPVTWAQRPDTRSVPSPATVNCWAGRSTQPVTCTGLPSMPSRPPSARQRPLAAVTLPVRSAAGGGASVEVAEALAEGLALAEDDGDGLDELGEGLGLCDAEARAEVLVGSAGRAVVN